MAGEQSGCGDVGVGGAGADELHAAGKQSVVAAVSTTDDRQPRRMKLLPVKGFRKKAVKRSPNGT
jgi:hypothetical protein